MCTFSCGSMFSFALFAFLLFLAKVCHLSQLRLAQLRSRCYKKGIVKDSVPSSAKAPATHCSPSRRVQCLVLSFSRPHSMQERATAHNKVVVCRTSTGVRCSVLWKECACGGEAKQKNRQNFASLRSVWPFPSHASVCVSEALLLAAVGQLARESLPKLCCLLD